MVPRSAYIDFTYHPSVLLQAVFDDGVEIVAVDGEVITDEGGVIAEHHLLMAQWLVILAEVVHQFRQFPGVFHEERLQDAQFHIHARLSYDEPVDVGIGIEGDPQRSRLVDVRIRTAVDMAEFLHVEAEGVEIRLIHCRIQVRLRFGVIEAVLGVLHPPAHDGGAEGGRRHVAVALCDEVLSEYLEVLYRRELLIEVSVRAQHVDGT